MVCVYCHSNTQVINSRPQHRLQQVWRRRSCTSCGAVFTTHEAIDLSTSIVVRSHTGRPIPFNRDKLFISIYRAVGHRKQSLEDASALTATIIAKLLHNAASARLLPDDIKKTSLTVLSHFDKAAAVQYQAYHSNQ
jgi:transcriptional repressor NrdR